MFKIQHFDQELKIKKIRDNLTKDKLRATKDNQQNYIYYSFLPTFNKNTHLGLGKTFGRFLDVQKDDWTFRLSGKSIQTYRS